mmetsp:Transcript_3974/g.11312  ORF Transcript_3974/g.11312 Transcript_3974/m.11312 type:complete len:311 (+) Transcript_3974:1725-2657(+)
MHQQQRAQEPELRNRKVGRHHSLHALLARDADADVRLLDHADVVGAVADRQRHVAVRLDERSHLRLLQRRHAAADARLALERRLQEDGRDSLRQRVRERLAVNDHGVLARAAAGGNVGCHLAQLLLHSLVREHRRLLVLARVLKILDLLEVRRHNELLHLLGDERARKADVDRRLHLVARQHPQPDARLGQHCNALRDALLQLVLNRGAAEQDEVTLHHLADRSDLFVAVLQAHFGLCPLLLPLVILLGVQLRVGQTKRAQPRGAVLLHVRGRRLLQRLVVRRARKALVDDGVSALAEEVELAARVAHDD